MRCSLFIPDLSRCQTSQNPLHPLEPLIGLKRLYKVAQAVTQSVSMAFKGALHPLLEHLKAQPAPPADPSRVIHQDRACHQGLKKGSCEVFVDFDDLLPRRSADKPIELICLQNQVVEFASLTHTPRPEDLLKRHVQRGWRQGLFTSRLSRRQPRNARASYSPTS